ncbi:hypothetical protein AAG906_024800 [Vitis piasezkii]
MYLVQLFIEQTPNHYHLSNEMGHLTQLSIGDTDVDDENERDEEDDRDDAIDTNEIHLPNDDENFGDRSNNPEVEFEVENTSLVASHMAPNLISLMTT